MFSIVDIRDSPGHVAAVAAWVHREWWSGSTVTPAALAEWVEVCTVADGLPAILVAVAEGRAIGSVFLHASEAENRPAYTPYLGALWVEPSWRRRGVGPALVRAVERHAARLGFRELYLNAAPGRTPFYEALGWRVVETGYGARSLDILRRAVSA